MRRVGSVGLKVKEKLLERAFLLHCNILYAGIHNITSFLVGSYKLLGSYARIFAKVRLTMF